MNEGISGFKKTADSLSEQKKNLNIALYYTHGDQESAKNMLMGSYKDLYVIKARFSASTTFGVFLLFFNIPYGSLANFFVIISHSYSIEKIKTNVDWRAFEKNIDNASKTGAHDNELTIKMKDELLTAFTVKMGVDQRANELKKHLELNDEITVNRIFKKFINDKFGFQNIDLSVDYEQISSLDMELYSITSRKIDPEKIDNKEEGKNNDAPVIEALDDEVDDLSGKDVQLILDASLVLSPIKGKSIASITLGDRLRISLDSANPKAVTVAKAFKAYNEEGHISPIPARLVSIKHLPDGGYKLLCLIANKIYARIQEEEENIKVAVEESGDSGKSGAESSKMPIIIIFTIVSIIIIAIISTFLLRR